MSIVHNKRISLDEAEISRPFGFALRAGSGRDSGHDGELTQHRFSTFEPGSPAAHDGAEPVLGYCHSSRGAGLRVVAGILNM
jgi:hypothetical protein